MHSRFFNFIVLHKVGAPTLMWRFLACSLFCFVAVHCSETGSGATDSPDGIDDFQKSDLPNQDILERSLDIYWPIENAKLFEDKGFDLTADFTLLNLIWPIAADPHTVAFNRFGTPIHWFDRGYFHTGFDIQTSSPEIDSTLVAPLSGKAMFTSGTGSTDYDLDYTTLLSIWDPKSHAVVQVLHIQPDLDVFEAFGEIFDVQQGDVVGRIARDEPNIETAYLDYYAHSHLTIIDGGREQVINPATYYPYQDDVPPTIESFYLLDNEAKVKTTLETGAFDLVIEVADTDTNSQRSFEVAKIQAEVTDEKGETLFQLAPCILSDLFDTYTPNENSVAPQVLDFGTDTSAYVGEFWDQTDLDVAQKTFRYAVTQLKVSSNGRCQAVADEDGFVEVASPVQALHVTVTVWDHQGNATQSDHHFNRDAQEN